MLTSGAMAAFSAFSLLVTAYFVLFNASQMVLSPIAVTFLRRYQRRRTNRARALVGRITWAPFVSIVVPARNEGLTIVPSVQALLALDYESCEIVVVNDGSTDDTLARLQQAFELLTAPVAFDQPLTTRPIRGVYRSIREPRLVVLDKENGGSKADAVNAGVNAASGALVLVIDADTVLEPDALNRAVLPFLEDPRTVAVGAHIAITNGCRIDAGRITAVALPRGWLARFQVVEYMRSFLLFRLACAACNGITIISGAFGLFRRDAVIAVGGFDRTAVGEDMDLTVRLQRHYRAGGRPFRITFDPSPLAWTQVPDDWSSLGSQRCRWRRGLLQVLWRQRAMIGNPRFGVVGLGVLPYIMFFEGFGPLLESAGYAVATVAAILGVLSWQYYGLMIAVSVLFGMASTLVAVLMSDVATRRYMQGGDLALLVAAALLENCGYRQLTSWWGCVGTVQVLMGKSGWGAITRRAFDELG